MIPKKIYLNYVEEEDFENGAEITWCVNPVSVEDCDMVNREYTDLSQVWHPAEEEPEPNRWFLTDEKGSHYCACKSSKEGLAWEDFVYLAGFERWAYIDDFLPKGGEK